MPMLVVAHSPTPSMVRTAASSNGEGKNALAACDSWCSQKRISFSKPGRCLRMVSGIQSFSPSHRGIAFRNDGNPAGA